MTKLAKLPDVQEFQKQKICDKTRESTGRPIIYRTNIGVGPIFYRTSSTFHVIFGCHAQQHPPWLALLHAENAENSAIFGQLPLFWPFYDMFFGVF